MCRFDHDPHLPAPWVRRLWRTIVVGGLLWLACSFSPGGATAQQTAPPASAWNDARALDLIARARARRARPLADSALSDYRADARGMVYFYLDSRALRRKVLVKTDQVALEVLWAQPDRAKQRIVGLRDESNLPNRMVYHLDHLTVVQNGFGDVIRLGDGDEVRDVPHPAAAGAEATYDYRLADSLTIRLPGRPEPVQAYEVEVRPRQLERSAMIGSVFVDRETADIVRMTFTFTPASYVDPRLDYINISLDNSLWDGQFWLPHEQSVEIRRQVPELDYAAAAVILARFRIRDYEFNSTIPDSAFLGYEVAALPRHLREAFPFEDDLYTDLNERGLSPPPEMSAVRRHAASLVGRKDLSGLPRWRFSIPDPGSVMHFNRAEGLFLGGGVAFIPSPDRSLRVSGGYAFGVERPSLRASADAPLSGTSRVTLELGWNRLRDIGVRAALPSSLNTLSAAFGTDYVDPFHATGATIGVERRFGSWTGDLGLTAERHRAASQVVTSAPLGGGDLRPVRAVAAGYLVAGRVGLRRPPAEGGPAWGGGASIESGAFDGEPFARPLMDLLWVGGDDDRSADLRLRFAAGAAPGAPAQRLFLIGGLNTLPGYDYRSFVGDVFAAGDAELSADLWRPWIRGRMSLSAAYTDLVWFDDPAVSGEAGLSPTRDWAARTTRSIRPSAGVGIGLFFDILRADVARGLDGGRWQLLLSVHPDLWPIL